MIKFRQYETIHKQYELEKQRRVELEQELLKEIEFSNTIISRHKSTSPGVFRQ